MRLFAYPPVYRPNRRPGYWRLVETLSAITTIHPGSGSVVLRRRATLPPRRTVLRCNTPRTDSRRDTRPTPPPAGTHARQSPPGGPEHPDHTTDRYQPPPGHSERPGAPIVRISPAVATVQTIPRPIRPLCRPAPGRQKKSEARSPRASSVVVTVAVRRSRRRRARDSLLPRRRPPRRRAATAARPTPGSACRPRRRAPRA